MWYCIANNGTSAERPSARKPMHSCQSHCLQWRCREECSALTEQYLILWCGLKMTTYWIIYQQTPTAPPHLLFARLWPTLSPLLPPHFLLYSSSYQWEKDSRPEMSPALPSADTADPEILMFCSKLQHLQSFALLKDSPPWQSGSNSTTMEPYYPLYLWQGGRHRLIKYAG